LFAINTIRRLGKSLILPLSEETFHRHDWRVASICDLRLVLVPRRPVIEMPGRDNAAWGRGNHLAVRVRKSLPRGRHNFASCQRLPYENGK
jgi:hypothetical protein